MADNSYNISIETKAQLEEIQRLLEELRAINAEISKINGQTFSAVNASAAELSNTGKALANAVQEQRKAFEEVSKSSQKASEALEKTKKSSKELKNEVDGTKNVIQGFYLELGAIGAHLATKLPSAFTASIKAFGEQELATQKLAAAIRSHGGNVSKVLPIMQEFASQMQEITTYGDEQILAMQSMATSMGVSGDQMESVIKSAIGLSTALNMDVMTAVKAASAAIQGKTTMLQEYIPSLSKCKTEEEKLAKVQELSTSGFMQAKAEADTLNGKLKQAANAWGDVAEVVGGTFAPVIKDVAAILKFVCGLITENETGARILTGTLASLAVGFAFTKIGGLSSVYAMFKQVESGISTAKAASDGLNASLRANPLGLAATAVSAFVLLVSHLRESEKARYAENIKDSEDYRKSIEAEIEDLKAWGATEDANKKRVQEIRAEIEKLNREQASLGTTYANPTRGFTSNMTLTYYTPEEQKRIDNIKAKIETLNQALNSYSDVKKYAEIAEKVHAEALKKSNEILEKSRLEIQALTSATKALEISKIEYAKIENEIFDLETAFANNEIGDKVRVASANQLSNARKKLFELGKDIIAQEIQINDGRLDKIKTDLTKRRYDIEAQIAAARIRGERDNVASLKTDLERVAMAQRWNDLVSSYINSQKSEIKNAEDLERIRAEAYKNAKAILESEKSLAAEEKWLNEYLENTKTRQSELELEILRSRASGNESLAKEQEKSLRISQLTSEIFESTRKEGMSRKELESLQENARRQAEERFNLEKSVTDEIQRQNLAKNAQAKIEDILITNKIEQLKAEGKIAEAKELEHEREIKRTLAGLEGVSDENKKRLAKTMRQTNDYRERQETSRDSGRSPQGYSGSGTGGYSSGTGRGATAPKKPRLPATLSDKNIDLYNEWKEAGGEKGTGKQWMDYRDSRNAPQKRNPKVGAQARGFLRAAENTAGNVAGISPMVGGALQAAAQSVPQTPQAKSPTTPNKPEPPKPAASAALNNKLESMGVKSAGKDESVSKINDTLKGINDTLKDIKSTVSSLGEKK